MWASVCTAVECACLCECGRVVRTRVCVPKINTGVSVTRDSLCLRYNVSVF